MTKLQEIKALFDASRVRLTVKQPPSEMEAHVFKLIGQGKSTREIAKELGRSIKTVETHRKHLKTKLGISTGCMLVYYAVLMGAGK